jgi:hypothetical protein
LILVQHANPAGCRVAKTTPEKLELMQAKGGKPVFARGGR